MLNKAVESCKNGICWWYKNWFKAARNKRPGSWIL